jgi:predicted 2-oxoglutarate/Fe(II)-dependent dioxygenase YbiX
MNVNLEDYVKVVPNAFSDALIDDLMAIASEDKANPLWYVGTVAGGYERKDQRNVDILQVRNWPEVDVRLFKELSPLAKEYSEPHFGMEFTSDEGYGILRYQVGGFYKQHVDHFADHSRIFGCSIGLNDNYEGGEFSFWDRKKSIKLGRGDVLFFPSNFFFPHEVQPVTAGVRYTIVTWFK